MECSPLRCQNPQGNLWLLSNKEVTEDLQKQLIYAQSCRKYKPRIGKEIRKSKYPEWNGHLVEAYY